MLIAVLAIGALAAYYFGLRIGVYAAAGVGVLLVAALIPGLRMWAYVALAAGVGGILVLGPRRRRTGTPMHYALRAHGQWLRWRRRIVNLWSSGSRDER